MEKTVKRNVQRRPIKFDSFPTGIEARLLFATFYDAIKKFYQDPENMRKFKEWEAKMIAEGKLKPDEDDD